MILIIGILAAIAIPAFLGQREKAQDSEAKTAVRTAASAAKSYFTDSQTYVGMDVAAIKKIEPSLGQGQGTTLAITGASTVGYNLAVDSKTGNKFTISETNGVATRTCTTAAKAGCPTGGSW